MPQAMGNKDGRLHFVMSMQAADWNRIYSFLEYNLLALKLELKIIDFILNLNIVFPYLLTLTITVQNYSIFFEIFEPKMNIQTEITNVVMASGS